MSNIINPYRFATSGGGGGGGDYIAISNPSGHSGSIVTDGNMKYLTFVGTGTFDVDSLGSLSGSNSVECLIVAGGGGGSDYGDGGGGGAGGVLHLSAWEPSTIGEFTATVGSGGDAGTNGGYSRLEYGGSEESGTLADGGGYGNHYTSTAGANPGADGGSGGGGGSHIEPSYYVSPEWTNWMDCSNGGSATGNGAGHDGGKGYGNYGGVPYAGGGGGGAGEGGDVCDALYNSSARVCGAVRALSSYGYEWSGYTAGNGGDGLEFTQFSSANNASSDDYYGGGGGGHSAYVATDDFVGNSGEGGQGGGATGAGYYASSSPNGTDYTGGGGGGGSYYWTSDGKGGGGIIILRWQFEA